MIVYFGSDSNFVGRMEGFYQRSPHTAKNNVVQMEFNQDLVLKTLLHERPNCLIFDFSEEHEMPLSLFVQINYLRKSEAYRGIPIIGVFSSKEEFENYSYLFSLGLIYPHIRGSDESIFFTDIHYLSFEGNTPFSTFAKANIQNLDYQIKLQARSHGFSNSSLIIESDMVLAKSSLLKVSVNMFNSRKELKIRSQNYSEIGVTCNYLGITEFEIPFLGPWDDPASDLIHKDSYETWMQESESILKKKYGRILFISTFPEHYLLAGKIYSDFNYSVDVSSDFNEAKSYLENYNYDVVYCRMEEETGLPLDQLDIKKSNGINFENLYRLTNSLKNSNRQDGIFVIFNTLSKSNALMKALGYEHIVAVQDDISETHLQRFTSLLSEKGEKKVNEVYCYDLGQNDAAAEIFVDIKVSSITEHELTFYSVTDIPMYSILKIDVPCELFLLLVPPMHFLDQDGPGSHYMGFYIGVSESDREVLRSFVNQVVVNGLESFSVIEKFDLQDAQKEKNDDKKNDIPKENEKNEMTTEHSKRIEIVRKTHINGRTKL